MGQVESGSPSAPGTLVTVRVVSQPGTAVPGYTRRINLTGTGIDVLTPVQDRERPSGETLPASPNPVRITFYMPPGGVSDLVLSQELIPIVTDDGVTVTDWMPDREFNLGDPVPFSLVFRYDPSEVSFNDLIIHWQHSPDGNPSTVVARGAPLTATPTGNANYAEVNFTLNLTPTPWDLPPGAHYIRVQLNYPFQNPDNPTEWLSHLFYSDFARVYIIDPSAMSASLFFPGFIPEPEIEDPEEDDPYAKEPEEDDPYAKEPEEDDEDTDAKEPEDPQDDPEAEYPEDDDDEAYEDEYEYDDPEYDDDDEYDNPEYDDPEYGDDDNDETYDYYNPKEPPTDEYYPIEDEYDFDQAGRFRSV